MSLRNYLLEETRPNIAVVGAGVIGVSTALAILRKAPHFKVTIYTEHTSPNTTGDGAAGFWYPYFPGATPANKLRQWSADTWDLLTKWYRSGDPEVIRTMGIVLDDKPIPKQDWFSIPDVSYLRPDELEEQGKQYTCGIKFMTYIVEAKRFLPHLMKAVVALGGKFVEKRIIELEELSSTADIIINCSGLGARSLAQDQDLNPVRGQVVRVRAPWVNMHMADESDEGFCYIIPNTDTVVLGGTHQFGNWSTEIDPADKEEILRKCCNLMPSLKHATVVEDWAGLRPFRSKGVRLEVDTKRLGDHGKTTVIHNYGHGGSGVTIFWGCALEAADLAVEAVIDKVGPLAKL